MQADALFFWILAPLLVLSAFAVIVAKNPVHSVLFLILSFVCAAGLFLLMGAEFLAMILVVVYVGAVAVLFLFVGMLLDVRLLVGEFVAISLLLLGLVVIKGALAALATRAFAGSAFKSIRTGVVMSIGGEFGPRLSRSSSALLTIALKALMT